MCVCVSSWLTADKLKEKIDEDDKEKLEKAVQDGLDWLDDNQEAEKVSTCAVLLVLGSSLYEDSYWGLEWGLD